MVIKIDKKAIAFNINKAEKIAGGIPVSIMLKGFYFEYIAGIECVKTRKLYSQEFPIAYATLFIRPAFGTLGPWSPTSTIFKSVTELATFASSIYRSMPTMTVRVRTFVALNVWRSESENMQSDVKLYMMITSGCLNDHHPGLHRIEKKSGWSGHTFF